MKNLLVGSLLLIGATGFSQEQTKYDINDPRNPDCPCHKYQRLADEEYKKLLASAEQKNPGKKNGLDEGISSAENINSKNKNELKEEGISSAEKNQREEGVSSAENQEAGISENRANALGNNANNSGQNISNIGGNLQENSFSKNSFSGSSSEKKKSHSYFRKHKKKKRIGKYPSWLRKLLNHNWDICKESRIVSACFHWH